MCVCLWVITPGEYFAHVCVLHGIGCAREMIFGMLERRTVQDRLRLLRSNNKTVDIYRK